MNHARKGPLYFALTITRCGEGPGLFVLIQEWVLNFNLNAFFKALTNGSEIIK